MGLCRGQKVAPRSQGSRGDRLVFALILCKPAQRQLTTVVPDAMDLAIV